jgi:hypothetical protein
MQAWAQDKNREDILKKLIVTQHVMEAQNKQALGNIDALRKQFTEDIATLMDLNATLQCELAKANDASISLAIELQQVTEAVLKDQRSVADKWCNTRIELKAAKALATKLREKLHALRAKLARGKARALSGEFETWHKGVFGRLMSQLLPQTSSVSTMTKERYQEVKARIYADPL